MLIILDVVMAHRKFKTPGSKAQQPLRPIYGVGTSVSTDQNEAPQISIGSTSQGGARDRMSLPFSSTEIWPPGFQCKDEFIGGTIRGSSEEEGHPVIHYQPCITGPGKRPSLYLAPAEEYQTTCRRPARLY